MESLYFSEISENDIIATVFKLESKYSCGSDGLDMFIGKKKRLKITLANIKIPN